MWKMPSRAFLPQGSGCLLGSHDSVAALGWARTFLTLWAASKALVALGKRSPWSKGGKGRLPSWRRALASSPTLPSVSTHLESNSITHPDSRDNPLTVVLTGYPHLRPFPSDLETNCKTDILIPHSTAGKRASARDRTQGHTGISINLVSMALDPKSDSNAMPLPHWGDQELKEPIGHKFQLITGSAFSGEQRLKTEKLVIRPNRGTVLKF